MDVRKHLHGLGWKGEGHSLGKHATGIKKPLLITHKRNSHGLGAKSQSQNQADQWWLNAFDNALKDIGTGKESSLSQIKEFGAKGGLYGFFVRGKALDGTITEESSVGSGLSTPVDTTATVVLSVQEQSEVISKRRKRTKEEKEARRARKLKRRREGDPVDSHQDESDAQKSRSILAQSTELERLISSKEKSKRKKKHSKDEDTTTESGEKGDEPAAEESNVNHNDRLAEVETDKQIRRRLRAEKRARKEASRTSRETKSGDAIVTREKKAKRRVHSRSEAVT